MQTTHVNIDSMYRHVLNVRNPYFKSPTYKEYVKGLKRNGFKAVDIQKVPIHHFYKNNMNKALQNEQGQVVIVSKLLHKPILAVEINKKENSTMSLNTLPLIRQKILIPFLYKMGMKEMYVGKNHYFFQLEPKYCYPYGELLIGEYSPTNIQISTPKHAKDFNLPEWDTLIKPTIYAKPEILSENTYRPLALFSLNQKHVQESFNVFDPRFMEIDAHHLYLTITPQAVTLNTTENHVFGCFNQTTTWIDFREGPVLKEQKLTIPLTEILPKLLSLFNEINVSVSFSPSQEKYLIQLTGKIKATEIPIQYSFSISDHEMKFNNSRYPGIDKILQPKTQKSTEVKPDCELFLTVSEKNFKKQLGENVKSVTFKLPHKTWFYKSNHLTLVEGGPISEIISLNSDPIVRQLWEFNPNQFAFLVNTLGPNLKLSFYSQRTVLKVENPETGDQGVLAVLNCDDPVESDFIQQIAKLK